MPSMEESYSVGGYTIERGKNKAQGSTAKKCFIVFDAEDEKEACQYAYSNSPSAYNGIPRNTATVSDKLGSNAWKVDVEYAFSGVSFQTTHEEDDEDEGASSEDEQTASSECSFQCSASSAHVIKPVSQTCVYKDSAAPALSDVSSIPIGWNGKYGTQKSASGVDVVMPEIRETYVKTLKYSTIRSSSWRRNIAEVTGKVNSGSFKGWKAGEVLFLGCSYSTPTNGVSRVKVTFEFLVRVNESNAKIAEKSIGSLPGNDYAWVVYDDSVSSSSVTSKVKYIFKTQVYEKASFSSLGI